MVTIKGIAELMGYIVAKYDAKVARVLVDNGIPGCYGSMPMRNNAYRDNALDIASYKIEKEVEAIIKVWKEQGYVYGDRLLLWTDTGIENLVTIERNFDRSDVYNTAYHHYLANGNAIISDASLNHASQLTLCAKCMFHEKCYRQTMVKLESERA